MSASDARRIADLQKQVKIARDALDRIKHRQCGCRGLLALTPERVAEEALDEMWRLDQKQPLQGLVGHERRKR
jgi:hypothetical protein